MLEKVRALRDRPVFWDALTQIRALPCDLRQGAAGAVLTVPEERLALVVVVLGADASEEVTYRVQLQDMLVGEVAVDATLGSDFHFIRGEAFGASTDEVGAAEALGAFADDIGKGGWDVLSGELDDDEE